MSRNKPAGRSGGRSKGGVSSQKNRRGTAPRRVGSILEEYLARHPRMRYEVKSKEAVSRWPILVDEYARLHTEAVMVKDRVLFVHTDSSALASELTLKEEEYRNRLNRDLNMELVRKIVFKSGRVSTHGRHASSLQDVPSHLTAEHVKKIEEAVQHLDEEELREVMRRLLREMAERGRKRR